MERFDKLPTVQFWRYRKFLVPPKGDSNLASLLKQVARWFFYRETVTIRASPQVRCEMTLLSVKYCQPLGHSLFRGHCGMGVGCVSDRHLWQNSRGEPNPYKLTPQEKEPFKMELCCVVSL